MRPPARSSDRRSCARPSTPFAALRGRRAPPPCDRPPGGAAKDVVKAFRAGDAIERTAFAVVFDREAGTTTGDRGLDSGRGALVDRDGAVSSPRSPWSEFERGDRGGARPRRLPGPRSRSGASTIRSWCTSRPGRSETWRPQGSKDAGSPGRRAGSRATPADNHYAHPIRGLHAIVDLQTMEVVEARGPRRHAASSPAGQLRGGRRRRIPRRPPAARDRAAGGPELRGRRLGGAVAEVAAARRLQPAGRPDDARRRLRGRRPCPSRRPQPLDRRAGHPLRRPGPGG